ncbi:MAG: ParB N-terminal domain-containing protein, partial [Thiohalocapsa sp.]
MSTAKKRGLGRGLDALLGGARDDSSDVDRTQVADAGGGPASAGPGDPVTRLPLGSIERGRYQPRRDFDPDRLRELTDSIAAQGVIQPI